MDMWLFSESKLRTKFDTINSAELNSGKKMPVSLAEKHSKAKTGILSQNSASPNNAKSVAFCSFGTRRLHKRGLFLCQNAFPLMFDYF